MKRMISIIYLNHRASVSSMITIEPHLDQLPSQRFSQIDNEKFITNKFDDRNFGSLIDWRQGGGRINNFASKLSDKL
jgi:hypothetical protein